MSRETATEIAAKSSQMYKMMGEWRITAHCPQVGITLLDEAWRRDTAEYILGEFRSKIVAALLAGN